MLFAACAPDTEPITNSHGSTTSSSELEPSFEFDVTVDGVVSSAHAFSLGVIEATGADCQTSWTLYAGSPYDDPAAIHLSLRSIIPIELGSTGPAGASVTSGQLGNVHIYNNGSTTSYSSKRWQITALGANTLQVELEAVSLCDFLAEQGDDVSTCVSADSVTIKLLSGELNFDPADGYCREDTRADDGVECHGYGISVVNESEPEPSTVPTVE